MNVIDKASKLDAGSRKVCLAIGMFDGVHLGHQQVLRQTIEDAHQHEGLSVAVTFDRHPNAIVAPERNPPLIYSLPQKLRVIESLGIDTTWLIRFDQEFSRISGERFVRDMIRNFGRVCSLCVGTAFAFGHKRSGNVALLRKLGLELDFTVHGLASVSLDGKTVSSTRIRDAIRSGSLDAASQMLGRTYSLAAVVVPGEKLGQRIGIPTANLDTDGLLLPPNGVYAVHARAKGRLHHAVANIGVRPTVSVQEFNPRIEVHLLDFDGDLYEEELEVLFHDKLREEQKFASVDQLTAQIKQDIAKARSLFGGS